MTTTRPFFVAHDVARLQKSRMDDSFRDEAAASPLAACSMMPMASATFQFALALEDLMEVLHLQITPS